MTVGPTAGLNAVNVNPGAGYADSVYPSFRGRSETRICGIMMVNMPFWWGALCDAAPWASILSDTGCNQSDRCALGRHRATRHATSPKGGRLTDIDLRAIVNALLSKHRTGCQWRLLPADVPPMRSVRSSFDKWNRDGTCVKIHDMLLQPARQALDRDPEPSISALDSQSIKTTEAGRERGFDGEKSKRTQTSVFGWHQRVFTTDVGASRSFSDNEGAEWLL